MATYRDIYEADDRGALLATLSREERQAFRIIYDDLSDRRGLSDEFNACDDDIQDDVFQAWVKILRATP